MESNSSKGLSYDQPPSGSTSEFMFKECGPSSCKCTHITWDDLKLHCQVAEILKYQRSLFACTIRKKGIKLNNLNGKYILIGT